MTNMGKRWYCGTSGMAMAIAAGMMLQTASVHAQTAGGSVVAGQATITGQGTAQTVVTQSSDRAILDWNRFSLGAGDAAIFRQPDAQSITVNRVTGGDPSTILGSIQANGQVVLINRNGVLFGKGSTVDMAGLIVTTHDIDAAGFMAGDRLLRFNNGGNDRAEIVVEGRISIRDAGMAAFVAPHVRNAGLIQANMGRVSLGAGKGFGIDLYGDGLVRFSAGDAISATLRDASGTPLKALVENEGTIAAQGGRVLLTAAAAREVVNASVNVGGIVRADSATSQGGVITLSGPGGITTETGSMILATGTSGGAVVVKGGSVGLGGGIDASATGALQTGGTVTVESDGLLSLGGTTQAASAQGSGGSVSYSAARLFENSDGRTNVVGLIDGGTIRSVTGGTAMTSGEYAADGLYGAGGRIDLTASDVRLLSTRITATGRHQGGLVRVGGAFQGGKVADARQPYTQSFTGRWGALPSLAAAGHSFVNDGTRIDVSASRGEGGTAVIWSDAQTTFLGAVDARGATGGGSVEISSAQDLRRAALDQVTLGNGHLLLDPKNLIIGDPVAQQGWAYAGIIGKGYSPVDVARLEDGDGFGFSVALNGSATRLAVGSALENGAANNTNYAGAVYLFSFADSDFSGGALEAIIGKGYTGGKNVDVARLETGDTFGRSVALNSNATSLAVGAPGDAGAANNAAASGAVYLFRFADMNFSGASSPKIIGNGYTGSNLSVGGVSQGEFFGMSVALNASGDRLAVGAFQDQGPGNVMGAGAAYLFSFNDLDFNGASQVATIGKGYFGGKNIDVAQIGQGSNFGRSVALNAAGDRLAIGATDIQSVTTPNERTGAVFLYSFSDTDFSGGVLEAIIGEGFTGGKNVDVSLDNTDLFGNAVALSADGTKLAVGSPGDAGGDNQSPFAGSVRIFNFSDSSFSGGSLGTTFGKNYTSAGDVALSNVDGGEFFGYSTAFNSAGDRLAVGAFGDQGASNNGWRKGAAYLFIGSATANAGWSTPTYASSPSDTVTVSATDLAAQLAAGASVTLQASNDITVNRAVTVTPGVSAVGDLTLQAGRSVIFDANIITGGGGLTVIANDLLANGVVDAQRETGNASIAMNSGVSIDAGSGSVSFELRDGVGKTYNQSGWIILNTVAGGSIRAHSGTNSGSMIILSSSLTANTTGDAIVLVGRSFMNGYGQSPFSTPNGRWLIWSGDPSMDITDGLDFDFKQYGATYGQTAVAGTGSGLLYSRTATLGAALGAISKSYDGTTFAGVNGATATGVLANDNVVLTPTGAFFSDANAGSNKTITASGLAILSATSGGKPVYGYTLAASSVSNSASTITPAVLSISTPLIADKVYDGTTIAGALTIGTLSGLVGSETLNVAGTAAALSSRNAGSYTTNVTYTSSDGTNGGLASNYVLATTSGVSAAITTRGLAITDLLVATRSYDGTTDAALRGGQLVGVVSGDDVRIGAGSGRFADKNAGTAKAVTASGFTLWGGDADNYTLTQPTGLTGTITPRSVSLAGQLAALDKVYDTTTDAVVDTSGLSLIGILPGELIGLNYVGAKGFFSDKNVGANKTVTLSTIGALTGTLAGNYRLDGPAPTATASITPATLRIGNVTVGTKAYDGNTLAPMLGGSVAALGQDSVVLVTSGVDARFADKNVGSGKTVTVTGYTLSGTDAGNYTLVQPGGLTGTITRRESVAWTGAGDGKNWFDAANWAGGSIPDLANVASVWLPANAKVTFNGAGTVFIDRLTSARDADFVPDATDTLLEVLEGRLVVANELSVDALVQRGGGLSGAGSITVSDGFTQTGGVIAMTGDVAIRQGAGDMAILQLSGRDITVNGQQGVHASNLVAERDLAITSGGDTVLTGPTVAGRNLTVAAGASGVGAVSQSGPIRAGGAATFTAAGDIALTGGGNLFDGSLDCVTRGGVLSGSCAVVERRREDDRLTRFATNQSVSGGSPGNVREAMTKVSLGNAAGLRNPVVTLAEVVGDMTLGEQRDTTYLTALFDSQNNKPAYRHLRPKINLGASVYYVGH
ncbi:filamentous hemagglutinin family protein [Sphingobium sp. B1D7B]|uniref:YDG domain-containing protein n=1 Tax=Sphingobium sp. B1D7B TaxID=2940578 RepID=UPI0022242749|nr:YDG domain-containing protein [Sphingobium sp. B1D7B]MCW2406955.1 filamentous hemagglutinin family protein [Sphingobium sp. B1D7B]